MSRSASSSTSSLIISENSKVKLSDFDLRWQESLKSAWKKLKAQNKDAKKVIIRGTEHPSSTVPTHDNIVSCKIQDADGNYLGSAHVDENGIAYPNHKWDKNLGDGGAAGSNTQQPSAAPEWIWDENGQRYRYWNGVQWIWQ
ncbi:hypothetical protein K469DRAFT_747867 [Zopfia rhizophila CBS 207.26]|uniref:Uncharacterized protein n=1 Tax=Zopfia rhizophila CBS 207.26 TaxID=1314779 RepID=A0A6A6ED52_9PEZI|nr:hypothetical protein K469DRAFT_747867 [Zopfia rhizophila CBS 207.26]